MAETILPPPAKPLIRVSSFFTKDPSMSQSEFDTYWRETHGSLVVASKTFQAARIQKYTQVHNLHDLNKQGTNMGLSVLDFQWDACSEMYFQSWEDYEQFIGSDELRDVLGPDGARIMDTDKGVKVMVTMVDPVFDTAAA
ncbi:EthD domain-containing protein [Aspergillus stella-maris]|uniref:EthD domain-containing protein n=1 Tax=Aspergillus stella-maris TaxID=1810926 RepID=UPI003CCE1239